MELLTGKCKDAFEKWYENYIKVDNDRLISGTDINYFSFLTTSMQYGVYVDFFDSVGLPININCYGKGEEEWQYDITTHSDIYNAETRQEARTEAIKKANEIFNNG